MCDKKLKIYKQAIAGLPEIELKGKTMAFTSAIGYMFSQLNKAGEMGIRLLPKESREFFPKKYNTAEFISYGAVMKDYVLVPEKMHRYAVLIASYLSESFQFVISLKPNTKKK